MADTEIQWATKVWNFVRGCRRVSPGCGGPNGEGGCYAEGQANRFKGPGQPYEGLITLGKHGPRWNGKGRFVPEKLAEPLSWRAPRDGSRPRIFVNSMSDLFFEEFSNEQIAAGFGVMAVCQQHDFLILTKRAERMAEWFKWVSSGALDKCACMADDALEHLPRAQRAQWFAPGRGASVWPLPNVWLGVSAEDQRRANERIQHLLAAPAAIRFVSAEPLLGPIDFSAACLSLGVPLADGSHWTGSKPRLDWIIVGGESGNRSRPCELSWIRSIVRQCREADVPCFVKQLGANPNGTHDPEGYAAPHILPGIGRDYLGIMDRKGGEIEEWPKDLRVREFPQTTGASNG